MKKLLILACLLNSILAMGGTVNATLAGTAKGIGEEINIYDVEINQKWGTETFSDYMIVQGVLDHCKVYDAQDNTTEALCVNNIAVAAVDIYDGKKQLMLVGQEVDLYIKTAMNNSYESYPLIEKNKFCDVFSLVEYNSVVTLRDDSKIQFTGELYVR